MKKILLLLVVLILIAGVIGCAPQKEKSYTFAIVAGEPPVYVAAGDVHLSIVDMQPNVPSSEGSKDLVTLRISNGSDPTYYEVFSEGETKSIPRVGKITFISIPLPLGKTAIFELVV